MRRHEHCDAVGIGPHNEIVISFSFVFRDDMGLGKTVQCISLIW